mgnify:CR=1 FL=1
MKKKLFPLLLTLLMIVLSAPSCNQEQNPQEDPEENTDPENGEGGEDSSLKPGTFKFVASALKGKWNPGDEIYVHGALGTWAQTITLGAKDISSDGRTATVELDEVTELPLEPDGLYAAWPDAAVKHTYGILGPKATFSSCDTLLMAAYLQDDTFSFIDVSSSLAFAVSGDYNQFAIAMGNRTGINITRFEVEHTSQGTVFTKGQSDGYPFKYGSLADGQKNYIWMPGERVFEKGLSIYIGKDDVWSRIYTIADELTLTAGDCLDLGDITDLLMPYDGPAPRMPQLTGNRKKFTLNFQELSGLCLSDDESFLWGVGDEGDLAKISFEGQVLSTFHIGGDSEDVSLNPETGDLLIGLEPNGVGIVKGPDFNTRASTLFSISACNNYGNSGIEGIAYYKDDKIFVGAQSNSHLFLCDLASKKVVWDIKPWDKYLISEVGGLCYDRPTGWLWIIDSEAKKVFVLDAERLLASEAGTDQQKVYDALLGAYPVSEPANPESVCVDHQNGCIWVGDDYGDTSYLYRYDITGLDDAL